MNNRGSMRNRLLWVDALKGVLIVLVVLGHAIRGAHQQLAQPFVTDWLRELIYSFHMPAFMSVSGFVACRGDAGNGALWSQWRKTSWRRFLQLMVPFLLWTLPLHCILHDGASIGSRILRPDDTLWFLWALFVISVLFGLLQTLSAHFRFPAIAVNLVVAFLLMGVRNCVPDPKLLGFDYIAWFFFFFVTGYCIRKFALADRMPLPIALLMSALWLFLGAFWQTTGVPSILAGIHGIPPAMLMFGYRLATALVAIFAFFPLARKFLDAPCILSCVLASLGQASLGIYAVHMVLRFPLAAFLHGLFPNLPYAPLMLLVFASLLSLSILLVRLLSQFRLTSRLLLGKL